MNPSRHRHRAGYTLTEVLVVILIILLVSAATLPAILPAVTNRRIGDAARMIHAECQAAQDRAVRYNRPQGVRLMPDPYDSARPDVVTASRLIAIEPAPDYSEGQMMWLFDITYYLPGGQLGVPGASNPPSFSPPLLTWANYPYLVVHEDKFTVIPMTGGLIPDPPTMWYNNIRQGDKIKIGTNTFTIAGPIVGPSQSVSTSGFNNWNPERFINYGPTFFSNPANTNFEFMYLMDGIDNDGDGAIDEGFDGIDDDGNGIVDDWYEVYFSKAGGSITYYGCPDPSKFTTTIPPPYPNEFEQEGKGASYIPTTPTTVGLDYTILRRPVPTQSARIVNLPSNVVIDMTTWNTTRERSRLPIDPNSGNTDVMFAPDGHVLALNANANPAPQLMPFYHFWVADIEDVREPLATTWPALPMDADEVIGTGYNRQTYGTLEGERRLLTINTKTGHIVTNAIESFNLSDPNYVYEPAQIGSSDTP